MSSDNRAVTNPAARRVLEILEHGHYQTASGARVAIGEQQAEAEAGTRLYAPEQLDGLRARPPRTGELPGEIAIIDATTQEAAQRLAADGDHVLLNFASARNPGGGFLGGAKAQEEDLCRCSGLYRTLLTQPVYYQINRAQRSPLYTDHLIYSPRVPFFRTAGDAPLLETPFLASVITAPAPNRGAMDQSHQGDIAHLRATFVRRWANVLAAAEDSGHTTLLLGAWGCGAFQNDARTVAETAAEVLASPRFQGAFARVLFAIPGTGKRSRANLQTFQSTFSR